MRVSVIVAAYQAEPYLDTALASLAGQTRRPDEVIVVDDASTDRTSIIAKQWSDLLPVVLIRKDRNEGLGAARRSAGEVATGDLLCVLDSDDALLPDHLDTLTQRWTGTGCIVNTQSLIWFPGHSIGSVSVGSAQPLPAREDQARAILFANFVNVTSLFDAETYRRAGGYRPIRSCEDWDLWIRMLRLAGGFVTEAPYPTMLYRIRPDSLSAGGDGTLPHEITVLEHYREQVNGDDRRTVDQAIRRRRARTRFLAAIEQTRDGRPGRARLQHLRAALEDRNLAGTRSHHMGSVSARALYAAAMPRRALDQIDARRRDPNRGEG